MVTSASSPSEYYEYSKPNGGGYHCQENPNHYLYTSDKDYSCFCPNDYDHHYSFTASSYQQQYPYQQSCSFLVPSEQTALYSMNQQQQQVNGHDIEEQDVAVIQDLA